MPSKVEKMLQFIAVIFRFSRSYKGEWNKGFRKQNGWNNSFFKLLTVVLQYIRR